MPKLSVWLVSLTLIGILCMHTSLSVAADDGSDPERYASTKPGERIPIPSIVVQVSAPETMVRQPYVTIVAEEPLSDAAINSIYGTLNDLPFECQASACRLVVRENARLAVRARSSLGDESREFTFTIDVTNSDTLYLLKVTKISPQDVQDSCAQAWTNVNLGGSVFWQYPLASVEELHTENNLFLLAARLIQNNLVDASECPNGGLFDNQSPNACGMEKSRQAVIQWQNRFDRVILRAARDTGIPAKLLKSLIEQESQFWPGNVRAEFFEYGLGQLTEQGADVALRWDPDLYGAVCDGVFLECGGLFGSRSDGEQATLRGGLMRWFDATCPECPGGVDIAKAERSIKPLAQIVRANCYQVGYIIEKRAPKAHYETLWKFTMLSYHSGYYCLDQAVGQAAMTENPLTWEAVSTHLSECPSGSGYIEELWPRLTTYNVYGPAVRVPPVVATPIVLNTPTKIPTATPLPESLASPTPTPVRTVNGKISVVVYVDWNENEDYDPGEAVENTQVVALFYDNTSISIPVLFGVGEASFYNKMIDGEVFVELRSLYRGTAVKIPANGHIIVAFRLPPPDLPSQLP